MFQYSNALHWSSSVHCSIAPIVKWPSDKGGQDHKHSWYGNHINWLSTWKVSLYFFRSISHTLHWLVWNIWSTALPSLTKVYTLICGWKCPEPVWYSHPSTPHPPPPSPPHTPPTPPPPSPPHPLLLLRRPSPSSRPMLWTFSNSAHFLSFLSSEYLYFHLDLNLLGICTKPTRRDLLLIEDTSNWSALRKVRVILCLCMYFL